ncbi:PQQ-binding-like beta-propeller repeat protein [bacterium]
MKKISLLIFLLLTPTSLLAHTWHAERANSQGTASIVYEGVRDLDEWHYLYRTGRKYEPGVPVWASPALSIIAGHPVAFIGGYDQTMHALDLSQKKVMWRKITNGEIQSTAAIYKGVLFFGSSDRTLYALDAKTGNKIWTKELIKPSSTLDHAYVSSPFIQNHKLYITCFAYDKAIPRNQQKSILYCINPKTGNIIWQEFINLGYLSSPIGFIFENKEYITFSAKRGLLICLDATDTSPQKVWDYQMPHEVLATPVISTSAKQPLLFLGSKYGGLVCINALTSERVWSFMTGSWIDSSACVGTIDGQDIVYVGSHDYFVYALEAETGKLLWKKLVGAEVYSSPCFFKANNEHFICIGSLNNHIYILDAKTGITITSYFTGQPIWDKIAKGDTRWGSPTAISAGSNTVIIHGSFNNTVFVLPLFKACTVTAMARSVKSLWIGLIVVLVIFLGVVLPIVIKFN